MYVPEVPLTDASPALPLKPDNVTFIEIFTVPLPPVDSALNDLVSVVWILSTPLWVDSALKDVVFVVVNSISTEFVVGKLIFVLFVLSRGIFTDFAVLL